MRGILIIVVSALLFVCCIPQHGIIGTYGTAYEDTMRVVEDHSWRIELAEPDTTDHKQWKYTTGRWHKKWNRLHLTVDSRSYGPYWECKPFKIGWRRLSRSIECDGNGKSYVFKKVNYRKLRKIAKKEAKLEEKRKKQREEEKLKRRIEELEAQDQ